jgi:aryl carrier-like protein
VFTDLIYSNNNNDNNNNNKYSSIMDAPNDVQAHFDGARVTLGKIAADLFEIDAESLNWEMSFIQLGGDSILAIDFIVRCRDAGIWVDMVELLTEDSLATLADGIDRENGLTANEVNGDEEMADELAHASKMATLRDFSQIRKSYTGFDDLVTELETHGVAVNEIESIGPCSAVQESFFVSQAINPGSYISHAAIRLASADADIPHQLDTERVVSAWRNIVERHAILRTSFVESTDRPGKYEQLVLKPTAVPPRVTVFSCKTKANNAAPFQTGKFEVPMRLCVCKVSAHELQLELDISHALVDGQSAKILLHDLRASYLQDAYFSESVPLPYTDFAFHQQATLDEGGTSKGMAYWTSYMNKAGESHLPLVTTNPHLTNLETAHCTVPLPSGKLRAICGQLSITPANLFHIAWALALRRIILSSSITFSYIVSGRNSSLENIEATVGPFINTLPFSMEIAPETSVVDALVSSKRDWQEGSPFHNIPIAELAVSKTRSLKRLGNTLLSIERESSTSLPFADGVNLNLSARTSATDVRLLI